MSASASQICASSVKMGVGSRGRGEEAPDMFCPFSRMTVDPLLWDTEEQGQMKPCLELSSSSVQCCGALTIPANANAAL